MQRKTKKKGTWNDPVVTTRIVPDLEKRSFEFTFANMLDVPGWPSVYLMLGFSYLAGSKGRIDDKVLLEYLPARTFDLVVLAGWIPPKAYEPDPKDKTGITIGHWHVSKTFHDEFFRVLQEGMEMLKDFARTDEALASGQKITWKHPTPKELIEGFVGTKRRPSKLWLARQMVTTEGYAQSEYAAIQFIKLRCKEPTGVQEYTGRGLRQAEVLVKIFKREDSVKYANLKPQDFFWTAV